LHAASEEPVAAPPWHDPAGGAAPPSPHAVTARSTMHTDIVTHAFRRLNIENLLDEATLDNTAPLNHLASHCFAV
jgi:hypothetical protein